MAANCLIDDGRHDRLAKEVSGRVVDRLKTEGLPKGRGERLTPGVYATAGFVSQHQKEYALASGYYQQALALDYGNAGYRYELAECLYAMDRKEEAAHEARICLRFDPSMGGAKRIIADAAAPLTERAEGN